MKVFYTSIIVLLILNSWILNAQDSNKEYFTTLLPIPLAESHTDSTEKVRFCFDETGKQLDFLNSTDIEHIDYCIMIEFMKGSASLHWYYDLCEFDSTKIISKKKFIPLSEDYWQVKAIIPKWISQEIDTIYTPPSETIITIDTTISIDPMTLKEQYRIFKYYPVEKRN